MEEGQVPALKFFNNFPKRKYDQGEIIVRAGESLESVYFIISGIGRAFYLDENGSELTINLLKPNGIYPLSAALAGRNNIYDFQAFTNIEVSIAPVDEVFKYLEKENGFKNMMLKNFARGLEGYLVRSFYLIKGTAMQKVASTILMLLSRFGKEINGNQFVDLPLTHQDIANLSGITRETASIQIGILEKDKVISRKEKKFVISDIDALSNYAHVSEEGNLLNLSF